MDGKGAARGKKRESVLVFSLQMVCPFFCLYLPPHRTRLGLRNMTRLHRWLLLGLVMLEVVVGMRASTTAHSLARWHAAVSRIPEEAVLPLGFGSKSAEANVAAFLGDKLLGSAIALAQYESNSAAQASSWPMAAARWRGVT